jgi:hypothetical protein
MATIQELLAKSLERLRDLHKAGAFVIASEDLSATDRTRLLKAGYLKAVIRGWYLTSRPDERGGDTTAWQVNWKEFVARYCEKRFGADWHLSPEQSLHIHTETPLPSRQIHIHAKAGHNNVTPLIHGWSILDMKAISLAPEDDRQDRNGLRVLSLPYSLVQVSESFFQLQSAAAQIALELLPDISDLARILIAAGKPAVGGRLVAALRAIGKERAAADLRKTLEAVGYRVTEVNPFNSLFSIIAPAIKRSPYVLRIHQMWAAMRGPIIDTFNTPPGVPNDIEAYLADIEARYVADAYNSLSIEGYTVTEDLIERVRAGNWNPDSGEDKSSRNALAAKGYSLAHNEVKKTIGRILSGENAGVALRSSFIEWNIALWTPSVLAGILRPEDLAGYRNGPVYIRNADHIPPPREAVRDCMPEFFDLLEREEHAAVRAVLGHFIFVFIHPYMDGNGRLGRFLMNAMFASGGYSWTIVPVSRRDDYMNALNQASGKGNIQIFTSFLNELITMQSDSGYVPQREQ